jgi:hypothetical protein
MAYRARCRVSPRLEPTIHAATMAKRRVRIVTSPDLGPAASLAGSLLLLLLGPVSCSHSTSHAGVDAAAAREADASDVASADAGTVPDASADLAVADRPAEIPDTAGEQLSDSSEEPDGGEAGSDAAARAFTALPSLGTPRTGHTVTELADGRVLIVGGQYDVYDSTAEYDFTTVTTANAEIYDPATETFVPTGSLAAPRYAHSATLLVDGRVLIAGGYTGSDFAAAAELYDPASGTFQATGALLTPRTGATATLLDDGEVLIVGGYNDGELASCEVFDPSTGNFAATGSLTSARTAHTATLLGDGRVLVVGGDTFYPHPGFVTAEIFDPTTGTFSITGSLSARRDGHTATRLPDGRVLVVGGEGDGDPSLGQEDFATAELYDPDTGTFTLASGSLATQRFGHTATLLASGKVLVAGGMNHLASYTYLDSAELFDPATAAFTSTGTLVGVRTGHRAALLPSGKVLLVGGLQNSNSAEVYDPAAGRFYSRDLPRSSHTATLLADGKVLFSAQPYPMNNFVIRHAALYDPDTRTFTATGTMVRARSCHTATRLANDKVLLAGGPWTNTPSLLQAELYDPDTGTFTATGVMTSRCGHTATLLADGRVFLAGGSTTVVATEIFDPSANVFATSASLTSARSSHSASLLPSGSLLLVGGWGADYATLATAEIFEPATESILQTSALATARMGHTATTLPDGRVLIVGGWSGTATQSGIYSGKPVATAEIFDPETRTFRLSGSLATARFSHTATLLPDGKVLIAGGSDSRDPSRITAEPNPLASTEMFDPATESFTAAPALTMARVGPTATLLANGEVLVVGGNAAGLNGHETVARAELLR